MDMVTPIPMFHSGELEARGRTGFDRVSAAIRPFMPDQHRDFFALLPYLTVATLDDDGWPVATMLTGAAGFAHSPDPVTMRIDTLPTPGDPANAGIEPGRPVGMIGIDFATRRRNRANGVVSSRDATGFAVAVRQSFGNCAQYIQRRDIQGRAVRYVPGDVVGLVESMAAPDAPAWHQIAAADTFFVASRSGESITEAGGVDVSHRGGLPGFIHVENDTLVIPDFRGNRYFNTLGNLLSDPRAALLFVDFATGDLLRLQGETEIDWSTAAAEHIPGAERSWRFHPTRVCRQRGAIPLRWSAPDYAPTSMRAGTWR
jgi:predicted pyridoxine 5'-phosphate oxidase superfamily flavin-nucleotide-binding protein